MNRRAVRVVSCLALLAAPMAAQTRTDLIDSGPGPLSSSFYSSVSPDGRWVAFESSNPASQFVPGAIDTNGASDVFLFDRLNGTYEILSCTMASATTTGNGASAMAGAYVVSDQALFVAFMSRASDLGVESNNGRRQIFLRDRAAGVTELVSRESGGSVVPGDEDSHWASICADGSRVAFDTWAANLVAGDSPTTQDCFVRLRATNTTLCISTTPTNVPGTGVSQNPHIEAGGRYVAFQSRSTQQLATVDPTGAIDDIYVYDLLTNTKTYDSPRAFGGVFGFGCRHPALSSGGRWVVFDADDSGLVNNDTNGTSDVFVFDRQTQSMTRLSLRHDGSQTTGYCMDPGVSPDGRFVVFESIDEEIVDCDGSINRDAFVLDRDFDRDGVFDEATDRVVDWVSVSSHFLGGAGESFVTSISADGQVVSFSYTVPPQPPSGGAGPNTDIYIRSGIQEFASTYCTAKTNSLGCVPYCTFSGVPSETQLAPPFVITAHDVLSNRNGVPFYGFCARGTPFQDGWLCVDSPTLRAPVQDAGGTTACTGQYVLNVSQLIQSSPLLEPGMEMFVQFWSRDPGAPSTTGLTDAVRLRIQP